VDDDALVADRRQAIPQINESISLRGPRDLEGERTSPREVVGYYVSSPSAEKRRRLSVEDEQEAEPRDYATIPRIYWSPPHQHEERAHSRHSHSSPDRRLSQYSATESWPSSSRGSPFIANGPLPAIRTPVTASASGNSSPFEPSPPTSRDFRPTLPGLPLLGERGQPPARGRGPAWSDYALDGSRNGAQTYPQPSGSAFEPPGTQPAYGSPGFGHGYQQPRGQSFSGPSGAYVQHPMDRTPFAHPYRQGYPDGQMYEMMGEGSKQRKRRGNLPKETTDRLRAWFRAHLQHPYPTEDEKQDLMRQTGLQMSKFDVTKDISKGYF
jgi:hypothetical protein